MRAKPLSEAMLAHDLERVRAAPVVPAAAPPPPPPPMPPSAAAATGPPCRGDGRDRRGILITCALRVDAMSLLVSSMPFTSFTDTSTDAELEAAFVLGIISQSSRSRAPSVCAQTLENERTRSITRAARSLLSSTAHYDYRRIYKSTTAKVLFSGLYSGIMNKHQ